MSGKVSFLPYEHSRIIAEIYANECAIEKNEIRDVSHLKVKNVQNIILTCLA